MSKKMSREEKKRLKHKRHPFKYFNVFLFLFGLLLITNFNHLVYWMHPEAYVEVYGTTIEEGKDPFLGVFPRTKFSYNYNGKPYEANKTLYNKMLFVADTSEGYPLWVNKTSPDDTLIMFPIYRSFFNAIVVLLMGFCLWQIIMGMLKNYKRRVLKKQIIEEHENDGPVKAIELTEGSKIKLERGHRLVLVENTMEDAISEVDTAENENATED